MGKKKKRDTTSMVRLMPTGQPDGSGPVFPYPTFVPIENEAEIPAILRDVAGPLEEGIGAGLVAPLYRLVWILNVCAPSLMTTHTFCHVLPVGHSDRWGKGEFEWAQWEVSSQIVSMMTDQRFWQDQKLAESVAMNLTQVLIKAQPSKNSGAAIWISAATFRNFTGRVEVPGWAVFIGLAGFANAKQQAAQRWNRLVRFVTDTIVSLPPLPGQS